MNYSELHVSLNMIDPVDLFGPGQLEEVDFLARPVTGLMRAVPLLL